MIKKRVLAIALAICMINTISIPALASENFKKANINNASVKEKATSEKTPSELAQDAFDAINAHRKELGLSEYTWNDALALTASSRALEIATNNSLKRRDDNTYYSTIDKNGNSSSSMGECIGYGHFSGKEMVENWLGSELHTELIEDTVFNYSAIGVYIDTNGTIYYVEEFLK